MPSNHTTTTDEESPVTSSEKEKEKVPGSMMMMDPITTLGLNEPIQFDPTELRQTKVYQSTKRLLLWQRDSYLVGKDYADWRQQERLVQSSGDDHQSSLSPSSSPAHATTLSATTSSRRRLANTAAGIQTRATTTKTRSTIEDWMANIPYEPYQHASSRLVVRPMSYGHLLHVSVPFIPSPTVRNAVLPILIGLPNHPPIFHWTEKNVATTILNQQKLLDLAIHNALVKYLTNPNNRLAIKHSTQGYIARSTTVPDVPEN